ncbi:hypothetical protein GCM10027422_32970 [Hymenobacter arcticus]
MHDPHLYRSYLAEANTDASVAVRRVFGVYATAPGPEWYRLVLQFNHTYCLAKALDKGARWHPLLLGYYQLLGPQVELLLPATQRGRAYAWCASLLLRHGPGGASQLLPAPAVGAHQSADYVFHKQHFPKLLRCISQQFSSHAFAGSLTVGNIYVALGPASKADFVEVINDNRRVRSYPFANFRAEE